MFDHRSEVAAGNRFEFGENWASFLRLLSDSRIDDAQRSLVSLLGGKVPDKGRFLDIGSGSGIFSLAARRLGMSVVSFDFDASSVACTKRLRDQFYPGDERWEVLEGSILDESFVHGLGKFDVVYSWGVLHHTGAMWKAIDLATGLVAERGTFAIAIYNDQGPWSRVWTSIKRVYNKLPRWLRKPYAVLVMLPREMKIAFVPIVKCKPMAYFSQWSSSRAGYERGMSRWHDLLDWVGGYPFEVATPEQVFDFVCSRGFVLQKLKTCGGQLGCNEYVFRRADGLHGKAA